MLLKMLVALLLLCTFQTLSAQKIIIGGAEANRLLQWSDFSGMPDDSSPFFAYTAWSTKFKYSSVNFEGNKAILNGFEMTLEFNEKNSWVKKGKENDELLKHEQGHFVVGRLYMQELLSVIASTNFSRSDFQQEVRKIVKDTHQKYAAMSERYDKETNHSMKKEEQAKWNTFFSAQLK